MRSFIQKYCLYILYIPVVFVSIFLCTQNLYKGIFLIIIFTLWLYISLKKKNYTYTLLFIFFVIPFNITLQLNDISQPYVAGLFVNYLVPTLSILDIFISMLLVQLIIEKRKEFRELISDRYLLIFFILLIIQAVVVQNFLTAFLSLRLSVYIFTSILLVKTIKIDTALLRDVYVKAAFMVTILLQGVLGIYQFISGTSLGVYFLGESKVGNGMLGSSFISVQGENYLRAYGTFPHPNVLAGWYILMFFVNIFLYNKSKSKIYLFNVLLTLIFILFTFSRVSIILIGISFLVFLFKYILNNEKVYSIPSVLMYRFLNIFHGEDSSLEDRIKLLRLNISIFKENIFGVGLGNSIRYYEDNIPLTQGGKLLLQPVHNILILNWLELGILTGTYYIYILYRFFIKGIRLNTMSLLILMCVLIICIFDHYLYTLPQGNAIFFSFLILLSDSKL